MAGYKKRTNTAVKILTTAVVFIILAAGITAAVVLDQKPQKAEQPQQTAAPDKPALPPFNAENAMLTMGAGERLSLPAGTFSSDNTEALTVENHTLTAVAPGYATLTNGAKRYYVTVADAPSAIAFRNSEITLQKGEAAAFYPVSAEKGEGFSGAVFTSSDSGVVSVTPNGEFAAQSAGTAVVTAEAYNGKTASLNVTVIEDSGYTERTTIAATDLLADSAWSAPKIISVPADSTVQEYGGSADGRWRKVKFENSFGWIYNKAIEDVANFTEYTLETLPIMADDLIFTIGTEKRALFDFVYGISYGTNDDDADENLCLNYFRTEKGSCYTHGAMLCYLYNRCGYESMRLVGESAYEGAGDHSWCLTKTEDGWRHFDAQFFTIREPDEQFGVTDETYWQWFHWDRTKTPPAN